MPTPDRRELQRLRYWQGQMLRSQDFRDQLAIEAQLRWWHNRALHNAFGIASGFRVTLTDRSVVIHPGVAYDAFGHELIHTHERAEFIPSATEPMTLLARYQETSSFPRKSHVAGVCVPGTRSLLEEQPQFTWKSSAAVEVRDGVPLARVRFDNGTPALDADFAAQLARPLARPYIARGATIPGATAVEEWSPSSNRVSEASESRTVGLQVTVDTSAAGFTEMPHYFAWLQGDLWRLNAKVAAVGLLFHSHLDELSSQGFTYRFIIRIIGPGRRGNIHPIQDVRAFLRERGFFVCWLGIQSRPGSRRQL
jgi:hypothetical protein